MKRISHGMFKFGLRCKAQKKPSWHRLDEGRLTPGYQVYIRLGSVCPRLPQDLCEAILGHARGSLGCKYIGSRRSAISHSGRRQLDRPAHTSLFLIDLRHNLQRAQVDLPSGRRRERLHRYRSQLVWRWTDQLL